MKYTEFKQNQEAELNDFPMFFAFSQKQLDEGMQKLGVVKFDELYRIGGGGFIRKTDSEELQILFSKCREERTRFLANDENLLDSLVYELGDHEYCITRDVQPTLEALGLEVDARVNRIMAEAIGIYNEQQVND